MIPYLELKLYDVDPSAFEEDCPLRPIAVWRTPIKPLPGDPNWQGQVIDFGHGSMQCGPNTKIHRIEMKAMVEEFDIVEHCKRIGTYVEHKE